MCVFNKILHLIKGNGTYQQVSHSLAELYSLEASEEGGGFLAPGGGGAKLRGMCACVRDVLVPHLGQCVGKLFPSARIAALLGTSTLAVTKMVSILYGGRIVCTRTIRPKKM